MSFRRTKHGHVAAHLRELYADADADSPTLRIREQDAQAGSNAGLVPRIQPPGQCLNVPGHVIGNHHDLLTSSAAADFPASASTSAKYSSCFTFQLFAAMNSEQFLRSSAMRCGFWLNSRILSVISRALPDSKNCTSRSLK